VWASDASGLTGEEKYFYFFRRVCKIAKKRLLATSSPSVRLSAWNYSAPTRRIFMEFGIFVFSEKKNCLENSS